MPIATASGGTGPGVEVRRRGLPPPGRLRLLRGDRADFGRLPVDHDGNPDLHRPFIDDLTRPNPDDPTGRSTMRRVTDVLDVWFDSGSMASPRCTSRRERRLVRGALPRRLHRGVHRPDPRLVLHDARPGGRDLRQARVRTCVSHGIVLGSDGAKMSEVAAQLPRRARGLRPRRRRRDALVPDARPILRGGNLIVTEQGIRDSVRQVLIPLWNSWYFFSLYANAAEKAAGVRRGVLHRDATRWTATSSRSCATTSPR